MLFKMNRLIGLSMSLLLVVMMIMCPVANVLADHTTVQPRYSYTGYTYTGLSITTSGKAYCTADVEGYDNITTKIHINMQLQQYIALQWTTIAEWQGTFNDVVGTLSKTKQVYSGNYRVKAVYTVYSGSAYETITAYSQEKYITVTNP